MDKVLVAESDKVHSVVDCIVYGKKYSIVIMDRCRLLASGPAMLVYNQDGKLIDKTRDEGDDGRFQKIWRKHMNIARKHGL